MTALKPNQIVLAFEDEMQADYVKLMCRRKGTSLESYIVDNFEWDYMPDCLHPEGSENITSKVCKGCDWIDTCPDAKRGKK